MDKETLSHYGWIVVCLILGLFILLMSTPFGNYIYSNVKISTINNIKDIKREEIIDNSQNIEKTKYTITYELEGGSWDGGHVNYYLQGQTTNLPQNVTKTNYDFVGWGNNSSVLPENAFNKIEATETGNKTLYAVYAGKRFAISYNLEGGSFRNINNIKFSYKYGEEINLQSDDYIPKKSGFRFGGWYSNPALTTSISNVSSTTTGDLTLYARWDNLSVSVTQTQFNADSAGKSVSSYSYFYYGDYKYTRTGTSGNYKWKVSLNTDYTGTGIYTFNRSIIATDKEQICYSEILETAFGYPITNLDNTFKDCSKMTIAPAIPNNLENMDYAFCNCKALISAPSLPNDIKTMQYTFKNCTALQSAPVLSEAVEQIEGIFDGCTSLVTYEGSSQNNFNGFIIPKNIKNMNYAFRNCNYMDGRIYVEANPSSHVNAFQKVATINNSHVVLTGPSNKLNALVSTADGGSVGLV